MKYDDFPAKINLVIKSGKSTQDAIKEIQTALMLSEAVTETMQNKVPPIINVHGNYIYGTITPEMVLTPFEDLPEIKRIRELRAEYDKLYPDK